MSVSIDFGPKEWWFAHRVALRVLEAPDQAEDAAQDALLRAFTARASVEGCAKPHSWSYRIAHNTSERELGEILGVSANAAKQRAFRARCAARSHFASAST